VSDYYSYKPLVKLERPVALVGFPGCRPMLTTRAAAMITGLQTLLLPRSVGHHLGRTVEGLLLDGETASLHGAEQLMLEKALAGRSNPIIALGPTTLEDPQLREWIVERCQIVHLAQTLTEAVLSIEAEMKEDVRKHRHLDVYAPIGAATLRPVFDRRTALFREVAEVEIQVAGRGPLSVGRQIPEALGWNVEVA
jgi:shikimate kinase